MEDNRDSVSDCESGVSGEKSEGQISSEFFTAGDGRSRLMVRVGEEDRVHGLIKHRFVSSLRMQTSAEVVAIYRRNWSVSSAQATLNAFQIYLRAFQTKNLGKPNVKYAWFGASKDGIRKIIAHGFGHEEMNRNSSAVYGRGIYLSPVDSPLSSVQSTVEDEDGLRHVVLCRVLLGNTEAIQSGSDQTLPSSDIFDSGVDNAISPKRYIIWSNNMNTHILPELVVSFRAVIDAPMQPIPKSPWMPFPALIEALSGLLNPHDLSSVKQRYTDFIEKRISRGELVRFIRQVAGDKLLASIIKSCNTVGS